MFAKKSLLLILLIIILPYAESLDEPKKTKESNTKDFDDLDDKSAEEEFKDKLEDAINSEDFGNIGKTEINTNWRSLGSEQKKALANSEKINDIEPNQLSEVFDDIKSENFENIDASKWEKDPLFSKFKDLATSEGFTADSPKTNKKFMETVQPNLEIIGNLHVNNKGGRRPDSVCPTVRQEDSCELSFAKDNP